MTGNEVLILLAVWVQGAMALALLWLVGAIRLPRERIIAARSETLQGAEA